MALGRIGFVPGASFALFLLAFEWNLRCAAIVVCPALHYLWLLKQSHDSINTLYNFEEESSGTSHCIDLLRLIRSA